MPRPAQPFGEGADAGGVYAVVVADQYAHGTVVVPRLRERSHHNGSAPDAGYTAARHWFALGLRHGQTAPATNGV